MPLRNAQLLVVLGVLLGGACRQAPPPAASQAPSPATGTPDVAQRAESLEPAPEATPMPQGLAPFVKPWKGDLDGMIERRVIRVLTVQNPVLYFVDKGREVGITYEMLKAFEKQLNEKLGNKLVMLYVVPLPVPRDELLPRLLKGEGDIAAAQLTITPERSRLVDFSDPLAAGITEVLVTGPASPAVSSLEDLSGKELYVRASSSYAEHLKRLNAHFAKEGKPEVKLTAAPEVLEDGDILEMVSAGLVPATVTDSFMADLYLQVFPNLKKHADVKSQPGAIGWAFRKHSPKLAAAVNAFVKTHRVGSLGGNVLVGKYLKTTKWVKNARSDEDRKRFTSMIQLFKQYGDKYSLDHLLMAAQGYQESGLDQSKRSHVGAIGVMQVMPATARDKAVNIPDIDRLESNIHAGIKYNRWVIDNFYQDPAISKLDRGLFAFASYNAGPGRVAGLRKEAKAQGLDPNRWFNNVELMAAKRIGRETVTYVSNIYKYYLAYQLMVVGDNARDAAREAARQK
ncbi:MAG TPA: lytic transglycosylase F [Vicinamibacteria bacterium]|nr:lytic transglycosylase F [Vicinamibacteria bacterium]